MNANLVLRSATLADAELLLQWRNDEETRKASLSEAPVALNEHLQWLDRVLKDQSRKLFIVEQNGNPIGTVRADWLNGKWKMSWTVSPSSRGKGLAALMVGQVIEELAAPVCAEVKENNLASCRVAERLGMRACGKREGVIYYEK